MANVKYIAGIVTLGLDAEKCIGCGLCADVCPHGVFELAGGSAGIIDRDACIECGACARNCPVGAITARSGVGCAVGVINGALRGTEPTCGCCCDGKSKCC